MKFIKANLLIIFIVLFAFILRVYSLGQVPHGISNDEAGYIYSSYSILKTGKDVSGKVLPISLNLDSSYSPMGIYFSIPSLFLFDLSSFSGRLPYATVGVLTVLLLYFIVLELTKNRSLSLVSSALLSISPWHMTLSRVAYDGVFALFFYLLSLYVFIKNVKKGSIVWSLPFLFLAFYSYHATKIFFLPFVLILPVVYWKDIVKKRKQLGIFIIGIILILLSFLYVVKSQNVTRQEMFVWNYTDTASKEVNKEREKSIGPKILKDLFTNKPLYYLRIINQNYLEAFSVDRLFLYGDSLPIYTVRFEGLFYIIEFPFLFLGLYYLLTLKNNKVKYLIFSLLLISPLPSAFMIDRTYAVRSIMLLPFLIIIISSGLYFSLIKLKKNKKYFSIFCFFAAIIYLFLFCEFLHNYFFRFVVYGGEVWFGSSRDVSNAIVGEKNKKVAVIGGGKMFFIQYSIFNKTSPNLVQNEWKKHDKKIGSVTFIDDCPNYPIDIANRKFDIYVIQEGCIREEGVPIRKITDVGEPLHTIWYIYDSSKAVKNNAILE